MPIAAKKFPSNRIIEVPVKPHVYKILTTLYGDVVHACHNDVTGKAIANMMGDVFQEEFEFPVTTLKGIQVQLNYRIARWYERYGLYKVYELGNYFESVVQMMMFQHIVACTRCGKGVPSAIDDFFLMYGVDEDDYARQSAERLWYMRKDRFKKKKVYG